MLLLLLPNLGTAWGLGGAAPGTPADGLNIYDDDAAIVVYTLSSVTGLTAWIDYIPVAVVSDVAHAQWHVNETGFIPVYEEV